MSRVQETKRAYDKLVELLDQEIRKRTGSTKDLERFRESLDVAFYLLGWAQFEYLVRKEAEAVIDNNARSNTIAGHAWRYLKTNIKDVSVRQRLDLIFHNSPIREQLDKDYTVRNEAVHNYKLLPKNAKDVSGWLDDLEQAVQKFET